MRANQRSMKARAAVVLIVAATLMLAAPAAGASSLQAWFVKDGSLFPAQRRGGGVGFAVRAVLAGPTARERTADVRTAIPPGVPVRGIDIRRRVVTLDLGARVAAASDDDTMRLRVAQLVRTVMGVSGVRGVRILIEGGVPVGLFPGIDMRGLLTVTSLPHATRPSIRAVQQQLRDLGFLPPGGVTGVADDRLQVAVIAFQKWSGLLRDGRLDEETVARIMRATRPVPTEHAGLGRRIEVLLDRQLALAIMNDKVERLIHISTGRWGWSTPMGSFRIYRKERLSWSVPFEVWMPWASYFDGGIAFHEYSSVPVYPASHGCVRVNRYDAAWFYAFAESGTPVRVRSRL